MSKNDDIYKLLLSFVNDGWGEINGYEFTGAKVKPKKGNNKDDKPRDKKEQPLSEKDLIDVLEQYFKEKNFEAIVARKLTPQTPINIVDTSLKVKFLTDSEIETVKENAQKDLRNKLRKTEAQLTANKPEHIFDELLSTIKSDYQEIYKIFLDVIKDNEKVKTLLPALINIEYLLEIKKRRANSDKIKEIFKSTGEESIAQSISQYLIDSFNRKIINYEQGTQILEFVNNEVLIAYEIMSEFFGKEQGFDDKTMFTTGKALDLYESFKLKTLPIKLKKAGANHRILKALAEEEKQQQTSPNAES